MALFEQDFIKFRDGLLKASPVRIRWKIQKDEPEKYPGQLNLMFN